MRFVYVGMVRQCAGKGCWYFIIRRHNQASIMHIASKDTSVTADMCRVSYIIMLFICLQMSWYLR